MHACGPRSCGAGFLLQKMFLLVLWVQISHRGTPGAHRTKHQNCLLVSASVWQCLLVRSGTLRNDGVDSAFLAEISAGLMTAPCPSPPRNIYLVLYLSLPLHVPPAPWRDSLECTASYAVALHACPQAPPSPSEPPPSSALSSPQRGPFRRRASPPSAERPSSPCT